MFSTPILLIAFNRPIQTKRVLAEIRKQLPEKLFVFQDGARENVYNDVEQCKAVRSIIEKEIDWNCEVQVFYSDKNLGCGVGPAKAITWFFEHVEQGIILEDDCLPSNSFFLFCAKMLDLYKNNDKIFVISGFNPVGKWGYSNNTYSFSLFGGTWGWATWRRAWKEYDYYASSWKKEEGKKKVEAFLNNKQYYKHFSQEFEEYFKATRKDVWDFQWYFCRLYNESYSVVPNVNLIQNIGFDNQATHTSQSNSRMSKLLAFEMEFPIKNKRFSINRFYDWYIFQRSINPNKRSILKKAILRVIKLLYS